MTHVRGVLARIVGMFTKNRRDDDVREELESHLRMETAEYVRRGMDPEAARRQALLAAGGLTQATEAVREQRGLPLLESIAADVKYGLRALRRTPVFTAAVALTLALGIGANTAIFSVIRGVLLKPLPHHEGGRLVYLRHSMEVMGGQELTFSVPEVRDFRNGVPSLAGIAEWSSIGVVNQAAEGSVRWKAGLVTGNYFEVMGLSPILGRLTRPSSDDGPGAAPVAVLTFETWVNRFGADSGVAGKTLKLDGKPVTVIGVLEPAPFFPGKVDVILNLVNSAHHLGASMQEVRTHRMTQVVARLTRGASLDETRTQIAAVYSRMQNQHPDAYDAASHYRVTVLPFREVLGEKARFTLFLLMGAAALVLIIAVANVANLTLMRGVRREHELVVRAALGAGTLRLKRLLLVENLLLAFTGAALGMLIAIGGVELLRALAERYSPRASEIGLDAAVLGFTVALSVLVALVLSLLAWTPIEGRFAAVVAAGARRVSGSVSRQRLQRGLVVAQVAVSVVLLAGAGLLTRTLIQLSAVDTGLRADQLLTMQVTLLSRAEQSDSVAGAAAQQRFDEMRREIAALPGVTDVGVGSPLPLRKNGMVFDIKAEGRPRAPGEAPYRAEWRDVDPNYFKAAGIPLREGRNFAMSDGPSADVVVVNKTLVDRMFKNEDPVGRRIAITGEPISTLYPKATKWRTIVGVVGDTRDEAPNEEPQPAMFTPILESLSGGGLVIRSSGDASALTVAAARVVRRIAPTALVEDVMTIRQFKEKSVSPQRLNAALISSFGGLALLLAAVGIAGVLAFSVSARTNEIGIRMSLGADAGRVERMILGEGGSLVALGLVLGLAGSLLAGRVIRGLLFDIAPNDPLTLTVAALVMAAIGVAACWIPALRAARVDPVITMRAQ